MKKIIAIILVLSLVLSLSACGSASTATTVPTVTPTTSPTTSPTAEPTTEPTTTPEVEEEVADDWISLPSGAVGGNSSSGGSSVEYISWDGTSALTGSGYYTYTGDGTLLSSPTFTGTLVFGEDVVFSDATTLYMPNAHVEFYGTAGTLNVTTSATTFEAKSGAVISTLAIDGGNAFVEGDVAKVEITSTNTTNTTVTTASTSAPVIENSASGTVVVITQSSTPTIVATTSATYVKNETSSNISASTSADGESSEVESTNKTDAIIVLDESGAESTVGSTVVDETAKTALETLQTALDADGAETVVMEESVVITLGETLTIPAGVSITMGEYAITNYGTIAVCDQSGLEQAIQISGKILLNADVELDNTGILTTYNELVVFSNNGLNIDLNGNKLTLSTLYNSTAYAISVKSGKTWNIANGDLHITYGSGVDVANAVFAVDENASITLDNVNYTTNGAAVYATGPNAVINILNTEITAPYYAFGTNGSQSEQVTLHAVDTTFTATANWGIPVFMNTSGTISLDGCEVNSIHTGVMIRGGTANITDSVINCTYDPSTKSSLGNKTLEEYYFSNNWGTGTWVMVAGILLGNRSAESSTDYLVDTVCTLSNVEINMIGDFVYDSAIYAWSHGNNTNTLTLTTDEDCDFGNSNLYFGGQNVEICGVLNNNSTLTNYGNIVLSGSIAGEGTITNSGTITKDGATVVYNEDNLVTAIAAGGSCVLANDITTTSTLKVSSEVSIDMNGYTIDANKGTFAVFTVPTGGVLNISNGTITGANNDSAGGGINITGGTVTATNVIITGNTATIGGGVSMATSNGGLFTMIGGEITGNYATSGKTVGAGIATANAKFTISLSDGAKVYDNYATGNNEVNIYIRSDRESQLTIDGTSSIDGYSI